MQLYGAATTIAAAATTAIAVAAAAVALRAACVHAILMAPITIQEFDRRQAEEAALKARSLSCWAPLLCSSMIEKTTLHFYGADIRPRSG